MGGYSEGVGRRKREKAALLEFGVGKLMSI